MPYFSNKHAKGDADVLLIENNKILLDNCKVASILQCNYYLIIIFNQSLKTLTYLIDQMSRNLTFLMKLKLAIINKLWSHPKIIKLKQNLPLLKENLRLNRLQENSLKTSLIIYHGMRQLVVIYHLTS